MIGAINIGVDVGRDYIFLERVGDEEVINTPADISITSVGKVGPPSVETISFFKHSKGVDETCFDEVVET